jgi:transcriptional regulator with XRE-family HTH domain
VQSDVHPLRKERRRKPWTQQQLADFAGIGLSTVERAERGEQIGIESMQRLCTCLEKSPEELGLLNVEYRARPVDTTKDNKEKDANKHSPGTDSSTMQQPTPADTHQEQVYFSLSSEQVALLHSLVRGDDPVAFDLSKRDTLRSIAAAFLTASHPSAIEPSAMSDPEPWERLLMAQQASSPSTILNAATLEHFEHLLTLSWQLCNENQLTAAEGVLVSFLPQLLLLPRQEPSTASLTSRGLRLQSIFAHHHLRLSDKVRLCEQSVSSAREAEDANTLITALISLAIAYEYARQPDSLNKRLITLQDALDRSRQASPLVQSRIYSEYSVALAESGRVREAEVYMGLAQQVFPDDPTGDPAFAFGGGSMFTLSLHAGLVCVHTGSIVQAFPAFEHYKQHPSGLMIPERTRLEIANGQSRAAILANDAERYAGLLEDVLVASVRLGSQKRFDEALAIFRRKMPASWLAVDSIKQLAEQYGLKRERC